MADRTDRQGAGSAVLQQAEATRTDVHWNRQYYDNMAFHFWEPQHIGRTSNPDARIRTEADAIAKLRTLEVVLNHQMELFFRLAPRDLLRSIFSTSLGDECAGDYRVIGREFHQAYAVEGLTQPDLLFESDQALVAIELKLGAKTSLEQVVKYAALFSLMPPARRTYGLLFMGPKTFGSLWREKFADAEAVRAALGNIPREHFPTKLGRFLVANGGTVNPILSRLRIGFLSYAGFHAQLSLVRNGGPHHETYERLLAGMMAELEERGLVPARRVGAK